MSIYRGRYFSASGCDSGPRPGTDALVSWYLGAYADRSAANLGTYACKRLGSGWSIHAERRAADLGTSPYGGVDSTWGWALANALRLNSAELGVQLVILGRRLWSCTRPDEGWRPYGGDYHGHAHVELIPSAADNLTAAEIERTLHEEDDMPTVREVWTTDGIIPKPAGYEDSENEFWAPGSFLRSTQYWARRSALRADDVLAGQAALMARHDGQDDGATRAIVREELGRHRAELLDLLAGVPEEVTAEVTAALGERDGAAIEAAVTRVLDRVRVEVTG